MVITIDDSLKEFLSAHLSVNSSRLQPETRLNQDLGVDGDDGLEFMVAFSNRFSVEMSAFDPSMYFGPECSGNPLMYLWWFITRTWPKYKPITLSDLQSSINSGVWIGDGRNEV